MYIEGQGCNHPDPIKKPHFRSVIYDYSARYHLLVEGSANERRTVRKYSKLPENWKELAGIEKFEIWQLALLPMHPKFMNLLQTLDAITRKDMLYQLSDEMLNNYLDNEKNESNPFFKDLL